MVPPALAATDRMCARDILVSGQGVTDQDRVGFLGVERPVCLIGDGDRRQRNP